MEPKNTTDLTFTWSGALLGFVAYLVLVLIIYCVFN